MRVVRYLDGNGAVHSGHQDRNGHVVRLDGDIAGGFTLTDEPADVDRLLAPVVPPAIIGIGLNYRHHADESGAAIPKHPVVFFKAPNAVQDPERPIEIPRSLRSDKVDYECELAVVIGKSCKNVSKEDALDYVLGFTCANDVSARDWQLEFGGGQWSRGKMFDTFLPLGPCIATLDELDDPNNLKIKTVLNGETVQDWHTGDMIFDVASIIAFLSGSTTLLPGTVVLTGTPHGVGMAQNPPRWLRAGDTVSIHIEGIGVLTNPVIDEDSHSSG